MSFTRAGAELGLSQPTVSRHIAHLEEFLGAPLFRRDHNRLVKTEAGSRLAAAVALGLGHIEAAVRDIQTAAPAEGLSLACSYSFAHGWLLPRFSGLRRALGDHPVQVIVSYWLKDLDPDTADFIVTWQRGGLTERPRRHLLNEVVYPVASPGYLKANPGLLDAPDALRAARLLHYEERDAEFMGWDRWFARSGVTYAVAPGTFRYSNYQFMVQAAEDGEGVALGWHHLIERQVAEGRLLRVGPVARPTGVGYALEYKESGLADDRRDAVLEWFRKECARTEAGAPQH
jgi:LysR family glycine cleavage system transcriptional activator